MEQTEDQFNQLLSYAIRAGTPSIINPQEKSRKDLVKTVEEILSKMRDFEPQMKRKDEELNSMNQELIEKADILFKTMSRLEQKKWELKVAKGECEEKLKKKPLIDISADVVKRFKEDGDYTKQDIIKIMAIANNISEEDVYDALDYEV